jgi:hypothetical protein
VHVFIIFAAIALLFLGYILARYAKLFKMASQWRRKSKEALKAGKSVLFSSAIKLTLNGKAPEDYVSVQAISETGIILDPGTYSSVGTYQQINRDRKVEKTYEDVRLKFDLAPGKEHELGIFVYGEEVETMGVAFHYLTSPGDPKEVLVLACLKVGADDEKNE